MPRPGLFAALTVAAALLAPALYYGPGLQGLSYAVALVVVPVVAVTGVLRAGTDAAHRPGAVSRWLLRAAVPAGLLVDVAVRLPEDVAWLPAVAVAHLLLLGLGLGARRLALRRTSSRATTAALGIACAALGVVLVPTAFLAGPVLATAPLLLLAAALDRH